MRSVSCRLLLPTWQQPCKHHRCRVFVLLLSLSAACPAGAYNALTSQSSSSACIGSLLRCHIWKHSCAVAQRVWPAPTRRRRRRRAHVSSRPAAIDRCNAPSRSQSVHRARTVAPAPLRRTSLVRRACLLRLWLPAAAGRCTACPVGYFCAAGSTPTNTSGAACFD